MPLYRTPTGLLYYAHVPKAGGSSVEALLTARYGPAGLLDPDGPPPGRRWARTSLQHLDAATARRLLPPGPVAALATVRDPAARMLSEYRWRARSRARSRWAAKAGFSTWLACMLEASRRKAWLFDNHFLPQARIVPEDAAVFRLEDGLAPLVAWLEARDGPSEDPAAPPPHVNRSEARATKTASEPTPADLALIAEVYAEDYERFGYPRPTCRPPTARVAHDIGRRLGGVVAAIAP